MRKVMKQKRVCVGKEESGRFISCAQPLLCRMTDRTCSLFCITYKLGYHDCLPWISYTHLSFSFTTTWASKTYGKTRCSLVLYLQRQLMIMKDHLKATLSLAHWSLHFSFYGDSVMVSSTHLTSTFKMSLESVSYKRKSAFKETWNPDDLYLLLKAPHKLHTCRSLILVPILSSVQCKYHVLLCNSLCFCIDRIGY